MRELRNHFLSVTVLEKGAELCSVKQLSDHTEYIWQAGVEWPKHSPLLFPIVGTLKDGQYTYQQQQYALPRHGFARDSVFEVVAETIDSLTLELSANEATLQQYPFHFVLQVHYQLIDNSVVVRYVVRNIGNQEMYFSIGAHPAFNIPLEPHLSFEDYRFQLVVPSSQPLPIAIYPLTEQGLTKQQGHYFFYELYNELPLQQALFEKDAMVFKNINTAVCSLTSPKSDKAIHIAYTGFPYLGVWNKYGAHFICIEPWCGITDSENASGNLEDKEGIIPLSAHGVWQAQWVLKVT